MKHLVIVTLLLAAACVFAAERTAVNIPVQPGQFINQLALQEVSLNQEAPPTIRLQDHWIDPLAPTLNATQKSILSAANSAAARDDLRIVQLEQAMTPEISAAFVARGLRIVGTIPHQAYIVMVPEQSRLALAEIQAVRWTGAYAPQFRVSDKLRWARARLEQAAGAQAEVRVKAAFLPDTDATQVKIVLEGLGQVEDIVQLPDVTVATVILPLGRIDALAQCEWLLTIEYAPRPRFMNSIAADVIDVRPMWATRGYTGSGEVVAVADSGLDVGTTGPGIHADFRNGYGQARIVGLQDYLGDGTSDPYSGHGTHVAGSVLGNGALSGSDPTNNTYPASCYAGMAPRAKLHFQALGSNNPAVAGNVYPPANLRDLFNPAYTNGARIHQNSWGMDVYGDYDTAARQLDLFAFGHPEMLICFSAGNAGQDGNSDGFVDPGSMGSPGTAKNVLTVGATENNRPGEAGTWGGFWPAQFPVNPIKDDSIANRTNGMSAFSSRGPCGDGRYKPDIVAPGSYVASVRTHAASLATSLLWGQGALLAGNSNYVYSGGTSMSAPLVSGAAAVLREYLRVNRGLNNPPAPLLKAILLNGAVDLAPGQYLAPQEIPMVPNNVEGWGRCALESSLYGPPNHSLLWETNAFGQAGTWTKSVTVNDTTMPFKAHLAWTDVAGSLISLNETYSYMSGGGMLNDLDLRVVDPTGKTNYPNGMNARLDTYYYTNTAAQFYNSPVGMYEAEKCTAPAPLTITRIYHVLYDAVGNGGSYGVAMWPEGAGGMPGTPYFTWVGSVAASGPGFKYRVLTISPGITITGQHYFVGTQLLAANLSQVRDSGIGVSGSPRTYSTWTGVWTYDNDPDMWIHALGTVSTGDHINTAEGVIIPNPVAGTYKLIVSGMNVPYAPVHWGLAYSGGFVPEPAAVSVVAMALLWTRRRR
jgi:hypothetical protein